MNNYSWDLDCDYIAHYGTKRHSGRYPWGSGAKNGFARITAAAAKVKRFFGKGGVEKSDAERKVNAGSTTEKPKTSEENKDTQNQQEIKDLTKADSDGKITDPIKSTTPKEQDERLDPEKHEADRKAALESGDRNEIAKYFNESSYSELQQALNKANLKDMMNKSLAEAYKSSQPKDTTKDDWNDYVQQELWSGDLNRIMKVASDKSVNQNDLNNAITKANTLKSTNAKLNPSNAEKFGSAVDKVTTGLNKAVNLYESGAQSWNTVAGLYNTFNKSGDKLTMLPTNIKNFNFKDAQEAKSKEWEKYVKQELWSGDLNRIMRVANDKSVNNKDLDNAIAKANKINKTLHPDGDVKQSKQNNQQPIQQVDLKKWEKEATDKSEKELVQKMQQVRDNAPKPQQQQPKQEIKNEVKSAVQKVSNIKMDSVEKYATSLFPNDDNYTPIKSKSDNTSTTSVSKTSNKFENYLNLYDKPDDFSKNLKGINGSTYIGTSPDHHHPERPTYTQTLTSSKSDESFYLNAIYDKPINSISYTYFDWD